MYGELKVFSGRAHPNLAREICAYLNLSLGQIEVFNFADGEIFCQIQENVRGSDVFVIQPLCRPVNENLMELLITLDAFKRRVPITAKLVADLISRAGADRVLTMDLHAGQIQGFFDIPVDHMFAAPVLLDAIRDLDVPDLMIVSPDAGGVERARAIAKRIQAGLAIVDKRREKPNQAEAMHVIGEVDGRTTLILDDIIDTAGTLCSTINALREKGAARIFASGVHAILSGPALDRLEDAPIEGILVTNTTPLAEKLERCSKLKPLSVAPLLGEAVRRIHEDSSVSSLFV